MNRRLKVKFHGSKSNSGAGLLDYRELDEIHGQTDLGLPTLSVLLRGKNTPHLLTAYCANRYLDASSDTMM